MGRLNKNLKVGQTQTIITKGKGGRRKVTFKRMKMSGNLQWRITKNVKA